MPSIRPFDLEEIVSLPGSLTGKVIEIVVTRLAAEPEAVRSSESVLSAAERQRASRFASDRHRRRFVLARAGLRRLLGARVGERPESVDLVYGPHGKPELAPRLAHSDLRFNLSHSDDLAVYAFSVGREIGIDVEAIRVVHDADRIAARFFSHREYETYGALAAPDRPLAFFNCWTRKEAFVKALGEGVYHRLDSFDVSLAPGEPARILRVESMGGEECGWRLESFSPAAGFVGAVVTDQR
jgi:4'-phosphopantetheinyl transferase